MATSSQDAVTSKRRLENTSGDRIVSVEVGDTIASLVIHNSATENDVDALLDELVDETTRVMDGDVPVQRIRPNGGARDE